jgi:hypothetical protein
VEVTGKVLHSQWQGLDRGGLSVKGCAGCDRTGSPFSITLPLLLFLFIHIHVNACDSGGVNIALLCIGCAGCMRIIVAIPITIINIITAVIVIIVVVGQHVGLAEVNRRLYFKIDEVRPVQVLEKCVLLESCYTSYHEHGTA